MVGDAESSTSSMAVGVARGSQTWAAGLFCSILAGGDARLGKLGCSMLIPSCGLCMDGLCGWNGRWSGLCQGEGNIGACTVRAQGGVETGPRPTAHLQESVGHLQAFPISRCKADWIHQFLSPPRHPLLSFSAPHQPLLPDGQDISRSNTTYGTELDGTTLPTLLRTLLLTHSAIPGRHPMAGAKVCSPPREQPQAGSRGIPSRPVESFTNGPLPQAQPWRPRGFVCRGGNG